MKETDPTHIMFLCVINGNQSEEILSYEEIVSHGVPPDPIASLSRPHSLEDLNICLCPWLASLSMGCPVSTHLQGTQTIKKLMAKERYEEMKSKVGKYYEVPMRFVWGMKEASTISRLPPWL
jgi:hypothetical protein